MGIVENLDRLLQIIFVDSYRKLEVRTEGGGTRNFWIDTFTAEGKRKKIEKVVAKEYSERFPHTQNVASELPDILSAIKRDGAITRSTYEKFHASINAIARVMTSTAGVALGGSNTFEEDNEQSREVNRVYENMLDGQTPEHAEINVLGGTREGAVFLRTYDVEDRLSTFRVFHQIHRASVKIATVELDGLVKQMEQLQQEVEVGPQKVELDFPYDGDTLAYEHVSVLMMRLANMLLSMFTTSEIEKNQAKLL